MTRMQIRVTEDQMNMLKKTSAERGVSVAELIRAGIDLIITEPSGREEMHRRALAIVGKYRSGTSEISVEHDKYLDEIYSS